MQATRTLAAVMLTALGGAASAQTMTLTLSNDALIPTAVFNEVVEFSIEIDINEPIGTGLFDNPDINEVRYTVDGTLTTPTPSGFDAFFLQRDMTGEDFYAQGSSLSFEVQASADLSDGVQMDELVGAGLVFTFNAREVGNGRFHPALLELNADGTGRIQNSNNVITESPLETVDFGEEYITDINYDPGSTTLLTAVVPTQPILPPNATTGFGSGGPAGSLLIVLGIAGLLRLRRRVG